MNHDETADAPRVDAHPRMSRRTVLGAGTATAAVAALSACGTPASDGGGVPTASAVSGIPTSEVPVDGGKVIDSANVVVTQPSEGTFKAFDATCPHQGCLVNNVVKNVIYCPCHGSTFDATTGALIAGPAPRGLTPLQVSVSGSTISVQ